MRNWTLFRGDDDPNTLFGNFVTTETLLYYPTVNQGDLQVALEGNDPVAYIGKDLERLILRGRPGLQSRIPISMEQDSFERTIGEFVESHQHRQELPAFDYAGNGIGDLNIMGAYWRGEEVYEDGEEGMVEGDEEAGGEDDQEAHGNECLDEEEDAEVDKGDGGH